MGVDPVPVFIRRPVLFVSRRAGSAGTEHLHGRDGCQGKVPRYGHMMSVHAPFAAASPSQ